MEEQKYTMQGLEEYIRQGEHGQRERGEAWRVAIGLQQVDGLTPSSYLLDTYDTHIQSANSALKYSLKCKNCTLEDRLKGKGSRRMGKWEIMTVFLLTIFLNLGQVFAQSPNYNIGDVITNPDGSKGVVFWLSPDGSGGWMCALNDVSGTFAWSTQSVAVPGFPALTTPSTSTWEACATVTADTAGYSHTQKLRAAGNASAYPAAYAVDFAHGWYLPAIGQLLKLYAQQATISAVLAANGGSEISRTNYYWSSTYATNANGYYLSNPRGYWSTTSKSTAYYVRPVRSFSTQAMVYDTTLTYQWSNGASTPYVNVSPSVSSSYTVTATSGFGCSNTAEVSVVVANGSSQTLYDTICAGNSGYTLNGFNLTAAQTATAGDTVCTATLSEGTCSTTVTLHLHRKAPATATLNASICPGECYYLNGMELCNAGTYTQHLTAANGCDSTLTLQLSVYTVDTVRFNETICQGETYAGHGFDIPADSTMIPHVIVETQNFASLRTGCDSITILTLTINPVDTVRFYETVCEGEPYSGYGFNIPSSSTINRRIVVKTSHTTSQQTGCDSCTILTLTITPFPEVTIQSTADTICNGTSATLSASAITSIPAMLPEISVGDILCTDSSIVKPTDWPVPGKTAMGIVFFVDTSDQHGWALALKESSYAAWDINTTPNDVPGITNFTNANDAITDLNGQANTLAIKNMSANNFSNNEAAYRCYYFDHITGSVGSIHKGWYLPTAGQLGILYSALPIINNTINILGTAAQPFSDMSYWTSTEFSYYYAWNLIYNGAVYLYYKNSNNAAVRPCRTF